MYDAQTHEEIEVESRYDEMLDEVYPDIVIQGITFSASEIMKKCDPVAYQTYMGDWEDSELTAGNFIEELPDEDEDEDEDED